MMLSEWCDGKSVIQSQNDAEWNQLKSREREREADREKVIKEEMEQFVKMMFVISASLKFPVQPCNYNFKYNVCVCMSM